MLVIASFQHPSPGEHVVNQSIEHDSGFVLYGNVPFVADPGVLLPPVTGAAPGPGGPEHIGGDVISRFRKNVSGFAVLLFHSNQNRRSKNSQCGDQIRIRAVSITGIFLNTSECGDSFSQLSPSIVRLRSCVAAGTGKLASKLVRTVEGGCPHIGRPWHEPTHLERLRTMRVQKLWRPDVSFADDRGNSRQREFQFFRLR